MKAKLFSSLEEVIDQWAQSQSEETTWFSEGTFYWPGDLAENMAVAAAAVFDANVSGQLFQTESDA